MALGTGRVTIISTGLITVIFGFVPTWARFEAVNNLSKSTGFTDGTLQNCQWQYFDGTNSWSDNNGAYVCTLGSWSGGIVAVFNFAWDSFVSAGANSGVKINVANQNGSKVAITTGN